MIVHWPFCLANTNHSSSSLVSCHVWMVGVKKIGWITTARSLTQKQAHKHAASANWHCIYIEYLKYKRRLYGQNITDYYIVGHLPANKPNQKLLLRIFLQCLTWICTISCDVVSSGLGTCLNMSNIFCQGKSTNIAILNIFCQGKSTNIAN